MATPSQIPVANELVVSQLHDISSSLALLTHGVSEGEFPDGHSLDITAEEWKLKMAADQFCKLISQKNIFLSDGLDALLKEIDAYLTNVAAAIKTPGMPLLALYEKLKATLENINDSLIQALVAGSTTDKLALLIRRCQEEIIDISIGIEKDRFELNLDAHFKLFDNIRAEMRAEHTLFLGLMTFYLAISAVVAKIITDDHIPFGGLLLMGTVMWVLAGILTFFLACWLLGLFTNRSLISEGLLQIAYEREQSQQESMFFKTKKDLLGYFANLRRMSRLALWGLIVSGISFICITLGIGTHEYYDRKNTEAEAAVVDHRDKVEGSADAQTVVKPEPAFNAHKKEQKQHNNNSGRGGSDRGKK